MSERIEKDGLAIMPFATKQAFYDWMLKHYESEPAIWIQMYKKASGVQSIVWAEVVEVCLCFGWIDGVANKYNDVSYLQRLTPRRKRSVWSKINCQTSERLIKEAKMQPAGLKQIEAAKADGRWDAAYDSPKNMTIPEDFIQELARYPKALATFQTLKKTSLYTIGYSLTTAKKPETRTRRVQVIIDKLDRGELP